MGSLDELRTALEPHGWHAPPNAGVVRLVDLFNSEANIADMPILPQLHQGQIQQLLLTRQLPGKARVLTLRLWESDYLNSQEDTSLWIGSASSLMLEDRFWLLRFLRTDTDFNTPLRQLAADLATLDIRRVQRSTVEAAAENVDWDGSVLLINSQELSE
jgi:undecaprenyl-diphosphatase